MSKSIDEQLEALEKRKAQLKERQKDLKAKENKAARRLENRRKMILAGCLFAEMKANPKLEDLIMSIVKKRCTRPTDRKAMNLT